MKEEKNEMEEDDAIMRMVFMFFVGTAIIAGIIFMAWQVNRTLAKIMATLIIMAFFMHFLLLWLGDDK